jgi:hypothetical protein
LQRLQPGARVFVNHPHDGYVGIGRVLEGPVRVSDFTVTIDDKEVPILEVPLRKENIKENADDPELAEYMVRVRWEWTVPPGQGFWVPKFFSRRVTVTELRDPDTSRKVCTHAGIPFDESDESPT